MNEYKGKDFKWETFGEVHVKGEARQFLENCIQWIKEHGLKREPVLNIYAIYWEQFILMFTIGATVGGLFWPMIQEQLAQKNQTPTYESLKTSAAQDSVLPIFRKEPMTNPDTSNNKIADPNKKDKNEQIDNHK